MKQVMLFFAVLAVLANGRVFANAEHIAEAKALFDQKHAPLLAEINDQAIWIAKQVRVHGKFGKEHYALFVFKGNADPHEIGGLRFDTIVHTVIDSNIKDGRFFDRGDIERFLSNVIVDSDSSDKPSLTKEGLVRLTRLNGVPMKQEIRRATRSNGEKVLVVYETSAEHSSYYLLYKQY